MNTKHKENLLERGVAPAFSVIIPLEFHRGIAEKCVRAWSGEQDFPRERFEVIVAAPAGYSVTELSLIKSLLGAEDRLMLLPLHHDMDLVAAAAQEARGDVLLFTEAHCLPNPDVLSRAEAVLWQHPHWAGFSGGSIPVTHNALSEIEADMYAADIQRNLEGHAWLKVLDQIFVLRRTAYLECGGIEPEYGHFAEWLIAARLHLSGAQIGYEPSVAIHHYYIGELDDLVEFSEDFGRGQMRLEMQRGKDPAAQMFDPSACWESRFEFQPKIARHMLRLLWRNHSTSTADDKKGWRMRWWSWLRRSLAGTAFEWRAACSAVRKLRRSTELSLASGEMTEARDSFLQMIQACAAKGHLSMLREAWDARTDEAFTNFKPVKRSGRWNCGDASPMLKAGFHPGCQFFGEAFYWTLPEAMVCLPVAPGKYELRVNWIGFQQIPADGRYRFYINERPVPPSQMLALPHGMEIQLHVRSRRGVRLGWSCAPFHCPGDVRPLGMPLTGVIWKRLKKSAKLRSPAALAGRKLEPPWQPKDFTKHAPLYFLHVSKCMGTAVRFLLENAFPARKILAPWTDFYHLHELHDPNVLREPRSFVRGHFRWTLVDRVPDRDWRIITVLREPVERLLSKFDYMKQLHRLPSSSLLLEDWLRKDFRLDDSITGYFVVGSEADNAAGVREVGPRLGRHVDEALGHLRQCRMVGIQERPDETVNLFAWATGALPPAELRHVNRSERRNFHDALSSETKEMLSDLTVVDRLLYAEGRKMFEAQHAAMLENLRQETGRTLNPQEVRSHLRARALSRLEQEQKSSSGRDEVITWKADDVFPGENLDSRERHDGVSLRWTGPHEETPFHCVIENGAERDMTIKLHAATPIERARVAELWMDGHPIPLQLHCDVPGVASAFHGRITSGMLATGTVMRHFMLKSPVRRGNHEWRMLGLCLLSIEFRRCQPGG